FCFGDPEKIPFSRQRNASRRALKTALAVRGIRFAPDQGLRRSRLGHVPAWIQEYLRCIRPVTLHKDGCLVENQVYPVIVGSQMLKASWIAVICRIPKTVAWIDRRNATARIPKVDENVLRMEGVDADTMDMASIGGGQHLDPRCPIVC